MKKIIYGIILFVFMFVGIDNVSANVYQCQYKITKTFNGTYTDTITLDVDSEKGPSGLRFNSASGNSLAKYGGEVSVFSSAGGTDTLKISSSTANKIFVYDVAKGYNCPASSEIVIGAKKAKLSGRTETYYSFDYELFSTTEKSRNDFEYTLSVSYLGAGEKDGSGKTIISPPVSPTEGETNNPGGTVEPLNPWDVTTPQSCEELLGESAKDAIKLVIIAIRIITPLLLVLLSGREFLRAIISQDQDALVKAWKTFGTRAIITVAIMLLPTIVNLIGTLFDLYDSCGIW